MRLRTLLIAALLVCGFVYLTTRPESPVRRVFSRDGGSLWSGPSVALSAGLTSDEQNNIDVYKNSQEAVAYITSTVIQRTFFYDYKTREMGSGFIINADGQILTNYHVIAGTSQVEVTLPDQSRYRGQILARDKVNDLALIKIEPKKKLRFLTLGDSDRLQVGQKVLAIGNPFGIFQGTLTVGVVSSLHRDVESEEERLEGMIQTDAAINPGNSGGPLLDSQGSVIGINTAIFGSQTNVGVGFALPINRAKAMLDDFHAGRKLAPARLGVNTMFVAGDLAQALKLPSSGGLLIQGVIRGSAAAQAGLRGPTDEVVVGNYRLGVGGDLITAVDGKPVGDEPDAVQRAIARKHAGDTISLTIYRGGRSMDIKITLGEAPEERF